MRSRPPVPLLAFLLLAACAGCKGPPGEPAAAPPPTPAPHPVTPATPAATVPAQPARPGWIGVVVARESVDVKADSQGRLQSMRVSIGDPVRKGDPIATLDTSLAAQDLEMARSVLSGSQADLRRA